MTKPNSDMSQRGPKQTLPQLESNQSGPSVTFDKTLPRETFHVFPETPVSKGSRLETVGKYLFILLLVNFIVVICLL